MTTYGTIPTSIPSSSTSGTTNLEYISREKARIKAGLSTRRSWNEMCDYNSFNLPHGLFNYFSRIKTNVNYFRVNYAIIILIILFLSLLFHPVSLIVFVVMMVAWLFLYFLRDEPLVIYHRLIGDRVVLTVLSIVTIVLLLLLTDATMNIFSAVLIGFVVMVIHAALRKTDDLALDDDNVESGGY